MAPKGVSFLEADSGWSASVAQEKKPPYSVNVIEVSEEVMNAGIAKFHDLLGKYHDCKALDQWPGFVGDIPNDCFVPTWMEREMEDEI